MGGRDDTCWTVVDELGVLEQVVMDTPNTMEIPGRTIQLMTKYGIAPNCVAIDAGGGGKQIADRLAELGKRVMEVAFGEAADERKAYKQRRAEMYGIARMALNPQMNEAPFALPDDGHMLRQEMAVLPLMYDSEGRLVLPPKERSGTSRYATSCLRELLGRSPDRSDSLVLALWALHKNGNKTFKIDPARMQASEDAHAKFQAKMQQGMEEFMRRANSGEAR